MKYRTLLLSVLIVLAGCQQETTDRQTAVDDLAEKVIAEKAEQKKQAEQEKEKKKQIVSVGKTKAARVVEAFLLSDTAKGRARFVLAPKMALPRMEKFYEDVNLKGIEIDEISRVDGDGEGDPKVGKYGKYKAVYTDRRDRKRTTILYVKNTRDGIKIDWEAVTGFNELSWRAFNATRPTKPVIMRTEAQLSDYYEFRDTHYFVLCSFATFGYVRKSSRAGRQIYNILKDGESHKITLKVRHTKEDGKIAIIDDIVSDDWLIR